MNLRKLISNFIFPEIWPQDALTLPQIQIHRGYHLGGHQENTLEAFLEAKKRGAHMCECDLQLSSDDKVVIFHDQDLKRIKNQSKHVSELTSHELKKIANIPTLEEILAHPDLDTLLWNLELKSNKMNDSLARLVSEIINKTRSKKRVIFSSFNPFQLWMLQSYLPQVPRALLVTQSEDQSNYWILKEMLLIPFIKIHMLNMDQRVLTAKEIKFWKNKNMPLAAWTVNNSDSIQNFLQQGVQSIITDLI